MTKAVRFLGRALFFLLLIFAALVVFAPQSFGIKVHEYLATFFLIAAIYHILRNRYLFSALFRSRNAYYLLRDILSLLLILGFGVMLVTGVCISSHLFDFYDWPAQGLMRDLHLSCAVYCFIFLGLHLGLHAQALISFFKESYGAKGERALQAAFVIVAVIGAYVFFTGDYVERLLFQQSFSFFDYERAVIFPLIDVGSALIFVAWIGYLLSLLCLRRLAKD